MFVFSGGALRGTVLADTIFFEKVYVQLLLSKCLRDIVFEEL